MYIFIILLVVFLFRKYLSREYFTSMEYYLKMKYLETTNRIVLKEKLFLDGPLRTNQLCIDGYCITDKNLGFMSEIPYRYDDKIRYTNKDNSNDFVINEEDLYRLNHYWFEGQIVWYYGNIKKIPKGWALCDGKKNTPNLVDKFVIGYSDNIPLEGGSDNVVLKEDDMPQHSHRFNPYFLDKGNNDYNDTSIRIDVCPDKFNLSSTRDRDRCPLNPNNKKNPGGPCCYGSWSKSLGTQKARDICENAKGNWVNTYLNEKLCENLKCHKTTDGFTLDFQYNPYVCMMPNPFKKIQYKCPDNTVYWVGIGLDGSPLGTGGEILEETEVPNAPFDPTIYNKTVECSPLKKKPEKSIYNNNCKVEVRNVNPTSCKSFIPLAKENTLQGSGNVTFESVGGGKPHNNMPPWYGLYYIMKLKKKETN